jgi:hypothetical protein
MQITGIRKDIQELKRVVAFENKQSEDDRIKNMTDEELQQSIKDDLRRIGFESEAHYLDCAKQFILEKDEQANVSHEYAIHKHIAELCEDFKIHEEFMLQYSSLEFEK